LPPGAYPAPITPWPARQCLDPSPSVSRNISGRPRS